MKIEVASVEDLAEVQGMVEACGVGPSWPAEAWQTFVRPSSREGLGSLLLLARGEDGKLWGWLAASRVLERTELEYVLVHGAHRRQGVAAMLVAGWFKWTRAQGVSELTLEVRGSNEEAVRLYRRLGFVEQGRRPSYYRQPSEDALLMGRGI